MRKPYNILVFPFYIDGDNDIKFALFKRSDGDYWQGIAGGVEDEETAHQAAVRECYEEAQIPLHSDYIQLDASASIPANVFECHTKWPPRTYIVKEVSFGVKVRQKDLEISKEHSTYEWFTYQEANELLKWDSNKVAIWELNQRLSQVKAEKMERGIR